MAFQDHFYGKNIIKPNETIIFGILTRSLNGCYLELQLIKFGIFYDFKGNYFISNVLAYFILYRKYLWFLYLCFEVLLFEITEKLRELSVEK